MFSSSNHKNIVFVQDSANGWTGGGGIRHRCFVQQRRLEAQAWGLLARLFIRGGDARNKQIKRPPLFEHKQPYTYVANDGTTTRRKRNKTTSGRI